MTHHESSSNSDEPTAELTHDIPEWFIPEGEHWIGSAPEDGSVDPNGEPQEDGRPARVKVASSNGHELHTFGNIGSALNRDREGRLSCLSCNCEARDLELIKCPARNRPSAHVSIGERIKERRRERA